MAIVYRVCPTLTPVAFSLPSFLIFRFGASKKRETNAVPGNKSTEENQREMGRVFIGKREMGVAWLARTESEYSSERERDPHLTLLQILSYPLVGAQEEKSSLSL